MPDDLLLQSGTMPAIVDRPQGRSKGELSTGNRKQTFRMIDPRRLRVLQAVATGGSVAGLRRHCT
jgi:hypothetical protein